MRNFKSLFIILVFSLSLSSCIDSEGGGGTREPKPVTDDQAIEGILVTTEVTPHVMGSINPDMTNLALNQIPSENQEFTLRFNFKTLKRTKMKVLDFKINADCPRDTRPKINFNLVKRTPDREVIANDIALKDRVFEIIEDQTYAIEAVGKGANCRNLSIDMSIWNGIDESNPFIVRECSLEGNGENWIAYHPLEGDYSNLYKSSFEPFLARNLHCGEELDEGVVSATLDEGNLSITNTFDISEDVTKVTELTYDAFTKEGSIRCRTNGLIEKEYRLFNCQTRVREESDFE